MEKKFARSFDEIKEIVAFAGQVFADEGIDPSLRYIVDLAVEELFVNMVTYNTESTQDILLELHPINNGVEVSLTDFDVDRFDPTKVPEIDIDAPLEERSVGGLGLYLVLKMVDSIHYEYTDRESKITFRKRVENNSA
jgi:anti-sigma regulatory factor (Ser/Thr protein kinase)